MLVAGKQTILHDTIDTLKAQQGLIWPADVLIIWARAQVVAKCFYVGKVLSKDSLALVKARPDCIGY